MLEPSLSSAKSLELTRELFCSSPFPHPDISSRHNSLIYNLKMCDDTLQVLGASLMSSNDLLKRGASFIKKLSDKSSSARIHQEEECH